MHTEIAEVETPTEYDTPAMSPEAYQRWRAGIAADVKAYYAGKLKTYTLEETKAIMGDFMKKLEEKYASHSV